ncbi:DUF5050 domain-containing protein [Clostridium felsineum]|uniref:DUF5050 domain-containing protein n=1 Tax=Clostridium felsineum TaxID=36839 RepID=UPI00214D74A0|nr:DUF5050 domain-containing protein [Clostridium felsineum]MCR3759758.1 DUF5050 domain-containing protein [Clostridium felsineum]
MKKIVLILICIFLFSLVGCNKKVNDTNAAVHKKVKLDYPIHLSDKVLDNTSDITEDDNFIYYSDKNGINKLNKKSGQNRLILKEKNVDELGLSEKYIFFSVGSGKNMIIFRTDKKGKQYFKVFDGKDIPEKYRLPNFSYSLNEDNLYIKSGDAVFLYDMTSGKLKLLCNDVEKFQIHDGFMCYRDHAQRTFTIYKTRLDDMNTQIILGNGLSEPNKNIYDDFIFVGNDLYYTKRLLDSSNTYFTSTLYKQNGEKEINIYKNNEVIEESLTEYKGYIYFVTSVSDNKNKLMRYDPKDDIISQAAYINDVVYTNGTINIVNGYFYYDGKNGKTKCVKLK